MLKLALQVYLQEFAWTEAQKPEALAQRADHAVQPAERALLSQEPLFCFQTALALHRWSCLAYMGSPRPWPCCGQILRWSGLAVIEPALPAHLMARVAPASLRAEVGSPSSLPRHLVGDGRAGPSGAVFPSMHLARCTGGLARPPCACCWG